MLDPTTPEGRIVLAAIRIAGERPWKDTALIDVAEAAGLSLADVRKHFSTKGEIVARFMRSIDDEVLSRAARRPEGQSPRDALFEVVMSRFDALTRYRPALRSIWEGSAADPALARSLLASQAWMLNAAGIATEGVGGGVRVAGLATVYSSVFPVWLEDDDAGLARTMAALDRRLRRGERVMGSLDEMTGALQRMAATVIPGCAPRSATKTGASTGTVGAAQGSPPAA